MEYFLFASQGPLRVYKNFIQLIGKQYDKQQQTYEPGHEKTCLMSHANNKGADQPAHPRSLISTFVVRCLDSLISLDSIAEISRLYLAAVAAQAGLCLAWSETPEDTFCPVVAHIQQIQTLMIIHFKEVFDGE